MLAFKARIYSKAIPSTTCTNNSQGSLIAAASYLKQEVAKIKIGE